MPSFDIVSEIDHHELTNAIDQSNREIGTRFDFRGSNALVKEGDKVLELEAQTEFQITQMVDILYQKLGKRGIDIRAFEPQPIQESGSRARQTILVKQGVESELARKIVKLIKESKMKVQAAIQGEQVRVTGKKRDDLQEVIALLRETKLEQPLQFNNFRD